MFWNGTSSSRSSKWWNDLMGWFKFAQLTHRVKSTPEIQRRRTWASQWHMGMRLMVSIWCGIGNGALQSMKCLVHMCYDWIYICFTCFSRCGCRVETANYSLLIAPIARRMTWCQYRWPSRIMTLSAIMCSTDALRLNLRLLQQMWRQSSNGETQL